MKAQAGQRGMTERQAGTLEWFIIGICAAALLMIFQPFSMTLYSIGAGLVVLGGLAFNLVPLCRPGTPVRKVVITGAVVLLVLVVVVGLAIGAALLYGVYLEARQSD